MDKNYLIRSITKEEMKYPVEWAADEGWNPGIHDIDAFYHTDPNGFFVGFLDGKPISSISAVSYGNSFGFMGFYIVKPEYRGRGYGYQIWQHAVNYLKNHNIGLDGVVAQQSNYKKSGFKMAYRNIRFQTKGTGGKHVASGLDKLSTIPIGEIVKYDQQFFPAIRNTFLEYWFAQAQSTSLATISKGKLKGYGMIRKCRSGYKIGPLFADSKTYADKLLTSLLSFAPKGTDVYFDVPEPNIAAMALAQKYQMTKVFETARMYTKGDPGIPINKVFGITTFELG